MTTHDKISRGLTVSLRWYRIAQVFRVLGIAGAAMLVLIYDDWTKGIIVLISLWIISIYALWCSDVTYPIGKLRDDE